MNNEIIKYNKNNFIIKIRKMFYNITHKIFGKNKKNIYQENTVADTASNILLKDKDDFIKDIQVNSKQAKKVIEKNQFLEQIEGNVEVLEKLSTDRLLKLEKYYDEIILKNDNKIKKLKVEN